MSVSIQTNVNSLIAQQNMRVNDNFQSQTIQQLTSGYRINNSGDDAAGLAVANKYRSDIAELTQGVLNANDGISQLQIIDGGMNNISQMLDRLKTLATQSASDTFSGSRDVPNAEFQTLLGEINRQAQAIGLDTGGNFNKSLGVYIGGGKDNSGAVSTTNGTVTVNLANSQVDSQALGLSGMQVVGGTTDIGTGSANASVHAIVNNAVNQASETTSGTTVFNIAGSGFSAGVAVSVNLSGVTDINTLVAAVNAGIQNAGNGTSQAATALKNANIVASVHTDANNGQELAFSSSTSAFQVSSGDTMANALLGNFSPGATNPAQGLGSTLVGGATSANPTTTVTTADLAVNVGGTSITLAHASDAHVSDAILDLETQINTGSTGNGLILKNAGYTVDQNADGNLVFSNSKTPGTSFAVTMTGVDASLYGFVTTVGQNSVSGVGTINSGGASATGDLALTALTGSNTQAVTISGNDASGAAQSKTITLSATTGDTVAHAVAAINTALQQSNNPTLQSVIAVQDNSSGTAKVNFISSMQSFQVSLGTGNTLASPQGILAADGKQGEVVNGAVTGTGSTISIDTQAGAVAAVTAIETAVSKLGSAQSAVGRGENLLNYAQNLAQSQISNYSAAQSRIRDADVAAEAGNLTKAQVLQQASIAAMAQANSAPQAILKLLG
jgi:flagellin